MAPRTEKAPLTKAKTKTTPKIICKSSRFDEIISKSPRFDEMPKAKASKKEVRGGKRKKDPNAPKRGLSAYMFFANDQRDNVREENPGISFGQVGKVLGEQWKKLSVKDRKPYEDKAKTDKERYEREKAEYANKEDESDE